MVHKLMLVDDHEVVRSGVRKIFEDCSDIAVDCEAEDGQTALSLLRTRSVDGVLLDLSMPQRNGMDVLRRMREREPRLPILILSMHDESQYAFNVLKAGGDGYISKNSDPEEIIRATRMVLRGQKYVSPAMTERIATTIGGEEQPKAPHERLSPREFEVFCKLAEGASVKDIAEQLFLSSKTVSTHRARVLEKMELQTNADLSYYAIKHQIVE